MNFKEKFSEKPTVDILVLKVAGKKVTKAILNQIEQTRSYLPDAKFFDDAKIVGYVSSTDEFPWMIVEKNGRLLKSDLSLLLKIKNARTVRDAYDFVDGDIEDHIEIDDHFSVLPEDLRNQFQQLQDKANQYLTILKSHQIYI